MGWLAAALALAGCAAPVARIGDAGPFRPDADELALWRQAEQEEARIPRVAPRYTDPALEAYLADVAARAVPPEAAAAGAPPIRVVVLADPGANTFALPHGRVYVTTGVLARLDSEGQLAAVLAHEVAHVLHRDGLRAARARPRRTAGPEPADPAASPLGALGLRVAARAAVDGYGRAAERAADAAALDRLAAAGYDPTDAGRAYAALARPAADECGRAGLALGEPRWLAERAASVAALLARRPAPAGAAAPRGADDYARRARAAIRDNALLEARAECFPAAHAQVARALRLEPRDAVAHVRDGDVHRLEAQRAGGAGDPGDLLARARAAYERAAALDPAYAEPWRQLGLLHYQQREPARAREAFGRYLALKPDAEDARRIREFMLELDR